MVDGIGIGGTFAKGLGATTGCVEDERVEANEFAGALKIGICRPLALIRGSLSIKRSVKDDPPTMNAEKFSRGAWNMSSSQGG